MAAAMTAMHTDDAERDDVLGAGAHGVTPPSRCTVAPAGNGPWAGAPTTARASRRPTWSGVGTTRAAARRPRPWPARRAHRHAARRRPCRPRTRRDELGVGTAQVDHEDHERAARAFVLAHHHHAGARGGRPVHRPDRVAVEVLAHAARELGAAGREVRELRRGLRVADDDRTAGGLAAGRDVDGGGQLHRDAAPPPGEPERSGRDHLDAQAIEHPAPVRGHDEGPAGRRVDPHPVGVEREDLDLHVVPVHRQLDRHRPPDGGVGGRGGAHGRPGRARGPGGRTP